MFIKHYDSVNAKEILPLYSQKLPDNLMVDSVNSHGKFAKIFLSNLSDEQFETLKKECSKKRKEDNIFLTFYTASKANPRTAASEVVDFSDFDWEKIIDFKISGDTSPYQHSKSSEPFHYVSVVFVMD